ncbi:MAG: hypothetical protein KatS3mg014_2256 [Actinomycetota bacterium]|nr:MAG: hypothetical protein KatS3mg014_2256 [Actinomycetota bacterium]
MLEFEGRRIEIREGDTIASALYRAGVRTFNRSLKLHRRRGLYCLTGDCPNCLVTVDGVPGVRACTTEAQDGMRVDRETGWPSAETDLLAAAELAHPLMPVGFYSKTFIRPRFAWPLAERAIRRATGVGSLPTDRRPRHLDARNVHTDVLVVGGGVAGLAAALAAAERGERVVLADEGRLGEKLPPGPARERLEVLAEEARRSERIELLERHVAVGLYEGPLVPLAAEDGLVRVHPHRIVLATGAVETHGVFPGNDLPGVWLGRGAARMAGVHRVRPGERAVVALATEEGLGHLETLRAAGVEIAAVLAPLELADRIPPDVRAIPDGRIVAAHGRRSVRAVTVASGGVREEIACDALVLSLGLTPRDALLRMAGAEPVLAAGDLVRPGCPPAEAEETGRAAGRGEPVEPSPLPGLAVGRDGIVCLCEDVSLEDLRDAWAEGWRSAEILKRYTTATMGPCQGAMCGRILASFVAAHGAEAIGPAGARTTARPPRASGAPRGPGGGRPRDRGEAHLAPRAAPRGRRRDGALGLVAPPRPLRLRLARGPPRRARTCEPHGRRHPREVPRRRARRPDARGPGLPVRRRTPRAGALPLPARPRRGGVRDGRRAPLRDARRLLRHHLHLRRRRADGGVAAELGRPPRAPRAPRETARPSSARSTSRGPLARELLERLTDDPVGPEAIPYPGHGRITVAGVPCHAIRSGFVGELSFELHHPRSRGPELWDALMEAGRDLGIHPHGLEALDVLRLEKGHVYLGQDTLPDDHPGKLDLWWAVAMDKPAFVGKVALQRMAALPPRATARRPALRRPAPARRSPHPRRTRPRPRDLLRGLTDPRAPDRPRVAPRGGRRLPGAPARGRGPRDRGPDALLRPGGGEGPCLSSRAPSSRSSRASPRRRRSTPSRFRTARPRCAPPPTSSCSSPAPDAVEAILAEAAEPLRALDGDALVLEVTDGWTAFTLAGPDAREAFARLSALELPEEGFLQGDVARVPAKVLAEPERLHLLVPSSWAEHVRERILALALDVRERPEPRSREATAG